MSSIFNVFDLNPDKVYFTGYYLPTNQFRMGEGFRYRFKFTAEEPTEILRGYVELKVNEIKWVEEEDEQGRRERKAVSRTYWKDGRHMIHVPIGPGRPLVLEGSFTIPVDKGFTIPARLEWEIEAGVETANTPLRYHFPLTVRHEILSIISGRRNLDGQRSIGGSFKGHGTSRAVIGDRNEQEIRR